MSLHKQFSEVDNPYLLVHPDVSFISFCICSQVEKPDRFDTKPLFHHLSSITKSSLAHVRYIRHPRPILDHITARNIAIALIHSFWTADKQYS
jgi:hypothetical protein